MMPTWFELEKSRGIFLIASAEAHVSVGALTAQNPRAVQSALQRYRSLESYTGPIRRRSRRAGTRWTPLFKEYVRWQQVANKNANDFDESLIPTIASRDQCFMHWFHGVNGKAGSRGRTTS
jgi:hypothetical protein